MRERASLKTAHHTPDNRPAENPPSPSAMNPLSALLAAIALACPPAFAQSPLQQSHVEANVPAAGEFRSLLERDLLAQFRASGSPSATAVSYKLLRDGPTQTGVALPKYYAWVIVFAGSQTIHEGAARIAAVERTQFEITHFIPAQEINADPGRVGRIFPAPLVPDIISLAGAAK